MTAGLASADTGDPTEGGLPLTHASAWPCGLGRPAATDRWRRAVTAMQQAGVTVDGWQDETHAQ